MPNIAITTYCNLKCPYCFAQKMISNEKIKNISLTKFNEICNFINPSKSNRYRIGIIGGEPTLHPQFKEIIKEIDKQKNTNFILFTNGIELYNFLNYIPNNLKILINYNNPQNMSFNQYNSLKKTMDKLYELGWLSPKHKVAVGCNIYLNNTDYSFFWEIIDKYKISTFRVSIVVPQQIKDKDYYYNNMIPIYLDFIKEAKIRNVLLDQDCNQIPTCYFNQKQLKEISPYIQFKNEDYRYFNCTPVIDIMPDFKASSCFGNYKSIDCNLFENFSDLYNYFYYENILQRENNYNNKKCILCSASKNKKCQGGCLTFASSNQKGD